MAITNGKLQEEVNLVLDQALAEIQKLEVPSRSRPFDLLVDMSVVALVAIFLICVVMLPIQADRRMFCIFSFSLVILAAAAHFFDLPIKRGSPPKRSERLRLAR